MLSRNNMFGMSGIAYKLLGSWPSTSSQPGASLLMNGSEQSQGFIGLDIQSRGIRTPALHVGEAILHTGLYSNVKQPGMVV